MPEEINRVVADILSFGVPVHLRTRKMAAGIEFDGIRAIELRGFLQLEAGAWCLPTRAAGAGEEACILGVTLRENTERPVTVDVGANVLAGASAIEMLEATKQMLSQGDGWKNPFGDGKASNLILDLLKILSGE